MVEACNASRTERLANADLVYLENYIREFSSKYVYTHHASSNEPLTEKLRKSMTENVKSTAYGNLLNPRNKVNLKINDGKFVDDDQQILNFAKDDLSKNTSTKIPARLLEPLGSYIKSIGQISCGRIRGTCWLVTDMLVITNYHVYLSFNTERIKRENPSLQITVSFDYLHPGQTEHDVVIVEVDERRNPQLESSELDYKFLRLKENEGLEDRVRLGSIVRSRPLQDGRVVIVGHSDGSEMQQETCVIVSNYSWRERLKQRQEKLEERQPTHEVNLQISAGVHMTNDDKLRTSVNKYQKQRCLPYDTTLFSGASGSPVFDLNGNIVAMHTQGYTLHIDGRKWSLMEFGVQFSAICEDIRRQYTYNVVEQLFPNYNKEEDMDVEITTQHN
ncbi:Hypothetical predicted protein [Paramuricea clavata]|uniref:Uncharacterized protein n=1 Tax=Paramuricea clavata TaxID=317549 RepID=A0A7D9JXA6_PARCT|nr:Hypothetical predicted protein [Paramuricea clavata]